MAGALIMHSGYTEIPLFLIRHVSALRFLALRFLALGPFARLPAPLGEDLLHHLDQVALRPV